MGGMVTIAARYKNNETIAFKTSTNFFHYNMNSPNLMNEDVFKASIIEHDFLRDAYLSETEADIYDNRKGVIAPYDYGVIFLDYKNNKILSCNDYSAIIRANSAKLLDDYSKFLKQNFILKVQDGKGNTIKTIDVREDRFVEFQDIHFIHIALKNNAAIKIKGKEVKHNGTMESLLHGIYGIELANKSVDEQLAEIKRYNEEEAKLNNEKYGNPYRVSLEDYSDITFDYPNFELIECNNDNEHGVIYEYIKTAGINLTPYEHSVWQEYIEKALKCYKEQLDREEDY